MDRRERFVVWLSARARLLTTAGAVGLLIGGIGTAGLTVFRPLQFASTQTFAVGALAFAFGILGWSGSILAGRSIEGLQRHLDVRTDWTQRDSRRAMDRIVGFGAGIMAGVVVVTVLLP